MFYDSDDDPKTPSKTSQKNHSMDDLVRDGDGESDIALISSPRDIATRKALEMQQKRKARKAPSALAQTEPRPQTSSMKVREIIYDN